MTKPFDLLEVLAQFSGERRMSLLDPETVSAFVRYAGDEAKRALNDETLLHGQRAEAMFEALLVSLGKFRLLKAENSGRWFPRDRYVAPDFRVVLNDGTRYLIEVKSVYVRDPSQQRRRLFKPSYLAKLTAYAEATGAELKVAILWARWSIWTLVSPERLVDDDGILDLDMQTAMRVNELSVFGDRTIGTRAPLRLRVVMDPDHPSSVDAEGMVEATIGRVEFFCGDQELTLPVEQQIAWMLMQYGDWPCDEPEAILDDDRVFAVDYRWNPVEWTGQGFESIGTLSRVFARYFAQHTVDSGAVVQLRAPLRPNWFAPLLDMKGSSQALPLWRFIQQPNFDTPPSQPNRP